MIQSVLSAVPSFAMTCFFLPFSLCKCIQSILTRFWWDSKEGEANATEELGRFGIPRHWSLKSRSPCKGCMEDLDKTRESACACAFRDILPQINFCEDAIKLAISHGWRGILVGRDLLLQHLGKAIGNGESTSLSGMILGSTQKQTWNPLDRSLSTTEILLSQTSWLERQENGTKPELMSYSLSYLPTSCH